jgi:eukaryotic-like serine/threonine-protein kinase
MEVSAATWHAVSQLLDEALDLDPVARDAWINGIGETQPDLAPILRKLLAAHATSETDDVLQRWPSFAANELSSIEASGLALGSRIGPYRLKRELGSGGMADVWLAERADGAFERDVALKLPRISRLRRDLAMRFAHERDILARLEHPHIARFYDAGVTDDGLPYLAMEYVDGRPITTWCDEHRLDVPARIALFAQVLDAVQFAHANLVVHRDLKPSNLLVTEEAQVRLLDFGIAKLLSDGRSAHESQLTQLAGRALTPDYASPEQIKGEPLTIATDVYSLGVVLYELLAGQSPYQLRLPSVAQLEQAIVAIDPARPSSAVSAEAAQKRGASENRLARSLRGDLDTIVLKALAKQPAERYSTVAEFADDLRRHLRRQTVHARPASWSYRARKFVLRNRLAVGAAAAIGVALLVATLVSLWQARLAQEQARIAQQQAARAEAVKQFVLSFFDAANVDSGGTRQTTAVDLLHQTRDRLEAAAIADDAIRIELLTTVGWALQGLNEFKKAESLLAEAARLASTTSRDQDRIAALALTTYGLALARRGELTLAAQQFDAAEERSRRAGDMAQLSAVLRGKSELRAREGQYDKAVDLAQQSVRALERLPPLARKEDLLMAYNTLADFTHQAQRKGALAPARRGLALASELHADGTMPMLLEARRNYALALADEGEPAEALARLEEVRRLQVELLGADHTQVARTVRHLAELSLMLGDPASATEYIGEALRICEAKSAGEPTPQMARAKLGAGEVFANARRYDAALAAWRDSDANYSALYGADNELARLARSGVAHSLTMLGQLDAADAVFAALRDRPLSSARATTFKRRLARLRSSQGRHDEALALLHDALALSAAPPSDWTRALAFADLGHALLADGRIEEALEKLRDARTLFLKTQRNGSPDLADVAVDIARANIAQGQVEEAVATTGEAVAFWSHFDRNQRAAGVAHLWQGRALAAAGDVTAATKALRQASDILAIAGLPADQALLEQASTALRPGASGT